MLMEPEKEKEPEKPEKKAEKPKKETETKTKWIYCMSNFLLPNDLACLWGRMYDGKEYQLTGDESLPLSGYLIVNSTTHFPSRFDPKKCLVFQMEPNMETDTQWGSWSHPETMAPWTIVSPKTFHNVPDWHLNQTWDELSTTHPHKIYDATLSMVLSDKSYDPGHKKRLAFAHYYDEYYPTDIFGMCPNQKFKHYQRSLPPWNKNRGILPYKYTFNAENHDLSGYFTEKIIDGILGECLTFYWGCSDLDRWIPSEAYCRLTLDSFPEDARYIQECIERNEWEKRLESIRKAKQLVLTELSLFPVLKHFFG